MKLVCDSGYESRCMFWEKSLLNFVQSRNVARMCLVKNLVQEDSRN